MYGAVMPCALAITAGAAALLPASAKAQSTQSSTSRIAVVDALTITKIRDLDFGDIFGTNAGTIVLTPTQTPSCLATGGLVHTAECQAAEFGGAGSPNQRVRVRRPVGNTITLTGPGADMIVTDITIDGDPSLTLVRSNRNWERFRILSPDGAFVFRVGGTLSVNANQAPGLYTGTFVIRLDYQ